MPPAAPFGIKERQVLARDDKKNKGFGDEK
jgi:hypothetical protein